MSIKGRRQSVSICMIVRDEERNLPICLKPMLGLVTEMIVADTGSVDGTKRIAAALGAKVLDFSWCDSFSAARNESIKHATGDWILVLDADEYFDPANLEKLKRLLADLGSDNTAYFMKQVSQHGTLAGAETVVDQVRLFRNHPDHRWTYRVHEQIQPALEFTGAEFRSMPIVIRHRGYADDGIAFRKLERNLRLARLDLQERPDDAFVLFNLGSIYCGLNQPDEALPLLRRSWAITGAESTISPRTCALICHCQQQLGQVDDALHWCLEARSVFPQDVELLHTEADLRLAENDLAGAEGCMTQWLTAKEPRVDGGGRAPELETAERLDGRGKKPELSRLAGTGGGMHVSRVRHRLASLYASQQRFTEAEAQLKTVLLEEPKSALAHAGLGGIYLQTQRWADVAKNAHAMSRLGPLGAEEAAVQIGMMRMRQELFEAAYVHLVESAQRLPHSSRLKELLAEVKRIRQLPKTTVICAVWHNDPDRHRLLRSHQANLDRQTVQIERIYVFDNNDTPPPDIRGTVVVISEKISLYQAWNAALAMVRTPFVMNLNLDDRLAPDAIAVMEAAIQANLDVYLVGGDWRICYSQEETDDVKQAYSIADLPVVPTWPPDSKTLARMGSGDGGRGTLGPACLWRMAAHLQYPRYPWRFNDGTLIRSAADAIWWELIASQMKKTLKRIPLIIGNYYSHPDSQAEFRVDGMNELQKAQRVGVSLL